MSLPLVAVEVVVAEVAPLKLVATARPEAKAFRDNHLNKASIEPLLAKTQANRTPASVGALASKPVVSVDPLSDSKDLLRDSKVALARAVATRAIVAFRITVTTVAVRTKTTGISIGHLLRHSLSIHRLTQV